MEIGSGGSAGPPYPTPVQFDYAAAEGVLTALTSAIATLKARTASGFKNAARAQEGWKGAAADQFAAGSLPWMAGETERILYGMLELQQQMHHAIEAAKRLQHQHNLANQRWAEAQHHERAL